MRDWLRSLGRAALLAAALSGCEATVSGGAYGPDLVSVGPGVSVVADYDQPVFYSDGFYWTYYGDTWYRSPYYDRGWVFAAPPPAIVSIRQPYAYRHYRPQGWRGGYAGPPRRGFVAPPARAPIAGGGGGWRGAPAPAPMRGPVAGPAPGTAGAWRGGPAARPAPAPAMRPAPQQGRAAPNGHGWRR